MFIETVNKYVLLNSIAPFLARIKISIILYFNLFIYSYFLYFFINLCINLNILRHYIMRFLFSSDFLAGTMG
jgi:hypothetical protein